MTDSKVCPADFFNGPPRLGGSKWVAVGVADLDGDSGEPLAEAGGEGGEHPALAGPVTQGDGRATLHGFVVLVRKTFEHRRKTIRSALGYVLDEAQRGAICAIIDGKRRPESFSIEEWLAMYHVWGDVD